MLFTQGKQASSLMYSLTQGILLSPPPPPNIAHAGQNDIVDTRQASKQLRYNLTQGILPPPTPQYCPFWWEWLCWHKANKQAVELQSDTGHSSKLPNIAHAGWNDIFHHHHHQSLNHKVIGASQLILQPLSSIFLCSPLPTRTWWTPGLSISWCCLPTSSSVCLVFLPLSLCLARWFWPDLINWRHVCTTAVFGSLYDDHEVFVWCDCLLDLSMDFLIGNMVFVWDA